MSTCKATQHSDQMMCPCGLAWDVNDPEPPTCKTTGRQARASGYPTEQYQASDSVVSEQERRLRNVASFDEASALMGQQERRQAPRSSSLSVDQAHGKLVRLSALLRSSPVASAHNNKVPTEPAGADYTDMKIGNERVRVLYDDVRRACNPPGRVVVCAAISAVNLSGRVIVVGPRPYDQTMQQQIRRLGIIPDIAPDEGFIDQWGVFMQPEEALIVAYHAGQLGRRPKTGSLMQLFSEDLY